MLHILCDISILHEIILKSNYPEQLMSLKGLTNRWPPNLRHICIGFVVHLFVFQYSLLFDKDKVHIIAYLFTVFARLPYTIRETMTYSKHCWFSMLSSSNLFSTCSYSWFFLWYVHIGKSHNQWKRKYNITWFYYTSIDKPFSLIGCIMYKY